jgi:hypothetical protein
VYYSCQACECRSFSRSRCACSSFKKFGEMEDIAVDTVRLHRERAGDLKRVLSKPFK